MFVLVISVSWSLDYAVTYPDHNKKWESLFAYINHEREPQKLLLFVILSCLCGAMTFSWMVNSASSMGVCTTFITRVQAFITSNKRHGGSLNLIVLLSVFYVPRLTKTIQSYTVLNYCYANPNQNQMGKITRFSLGLFSYFKFISMYNPWYEVIIGHELNMFENEHHGIAIWLW